MRKFLYVSICLLVGFAPVVLARPAAATEMTWTMSSGKPYPINMKFYSRDGDRIWPGNNEVYVLPRGSSRTYTLACRPGASICYGAWPDGNNSKYWGVGRSLNNACSNCCYTCGQTNPSRNLVD